MKRPAPTAPRNREEGISTKLREFLATVFATPSPRPLPTSAESGRRSIATIACAVLIGAWLFAYKVRDFVGLGTTSDLYTFIQMSVTWPDRGFFHDNYWIDPLAVHSFLFSPLLWPLTRPFGAYGLFVVLAVAMALGLIAMERILRLFEVPPRWALAFAAIATLMPLSAHTYQNVIYSFNPELLEPVFALWLAYHLFRRAWGWALANALALFLLKEDAPLLVTTVAATVLGEELCRAWLVRDRDPRVPGWNRPALGLLVLGLLAAPALLYFISTQQPPGAPSNLSRLQPSGRAVAFSNYRELIDFVAGNFGRWLGSAPVADWRQLLLPATLGLAVLRPHLAVLGLATTAVAWLRNDNLIWAPRFVQTLALFQLVGCLGFASAWRLAQAPRPTPRTGRWLAPGLAAMGAIVSLWAWRAQFHAVPDTAELYRLSPSSKLSPADRQRADALFAAYRREGRREETVTATHYLFRYAHDRNLLWPEELRGRPGPRWILWDTEDTPVMGLWTFLKRDAHVALEDYELRGRDGRFVLLKRRTSSAPVATLDTGIPALTGDPFGMIRLKVKFPAGEIGHSEPLLSAGTKERGDVFHVEYEGPNRIVLGVERIGSTVYRTEPVACDPAGEHEIALFSGALYPPKNSTETPAAQSRRAYYENLISIAFDGREVLHQMTSLPAEWQGEPAVGINRAQASSTGLAFTGTLRSAERGGYPAMPGTPEAEFGAIRMRLVLPAAAAGTPEPLLAMGQPGAAILAYVRVMPQGKIKLGAEVWGVGAFESDAVPADSARPIELEFAWPGLFPPVGDPRWGTVPRARQEQAWAQLVMRFEGKTVLTQPVARRNWPSTECWPGKNPLGGSLVGNAFTGEILWVLREPL